MTSRQGYPVVITAFGVDQPGLLASVMDIVANNNVHTVDLKLTVLHNRFVVMIIGQCASATAISDCRSQLSAFGQDTGSDIQMAEIDSISDVRHEGNVILVARGKGDARARKPKKISQITSSIIRVISVVNEGNVESAELEVDRRTGEFYMFLIATIPNYRLNFYDLKKQIDDLRVQFNHEVEIVIRSEEALRYIYRVDTE